MNNSPPLNPLDIKIRLWVGIVGVCAVLVAFVFGMKLGVSASNNVQDRDNVCMDHKWIGSYPLIPNQDEYFIPHMQKDNDKDNNTEDSTLGEDEEFIKDFIVPEEKDTESL